MFKIIIKGVLKFMLGSIVFALLYTCTKKADPESGDGLLRIFSSIFAALITIQILEDIADLDKK